MNRRTTVWEPITEFTFLDNNEIQTFEKSNYIIKQNEPFIHYYAKEMLITREKITEFYRSFENPFILDSLHQAKFTCSFDYSRYPFDEEKCSFYISLVKSSATLRAVNVSYQGSAIMGQFQIHKDNWKIECNNSTRVEVQTQTI